MEDTTKFEDRFSTRVPVPSTRSVSQPANLYDMILSAAYGGEDHAREYDEGKARQAQVEQAVATLFGVHPPDQIYHRGAVIDDAGEYVEIETRHGAEGARLFPVWSEDKTGVVGFRVRGRCNACKREFPSAAVATTLAEVGHLSEGFHELEPHNCPGLDLNDSEALMRIAIQSMDQGGHEERAYIWALLAQAAATNNLVQVNAERWANA